MGETLKSPLLVEVICEFNFMPTENWDWAIPGQMYGLVGKEYQKKQQVNSLGVKVKPSQMTTNLDVQTAVARIQLIKNDDTAMVQIGPNQLIFNYLRKYTSWEDFRSETLSVYENYMKIISEAEISSIGLRYINQIALEGDPIDLQDYITLDQEMLKALDKPLAYFFQRYDIQHDMPPGVLIHQTGLRSDESENRFIMLDLDFQSMGTIQDDDGIIETWLDSAHDIIYEFFIKSLNPELLKKMKEGINEQQ